jgi:hypothetical protein
MKKILIFTVTVIVSFAYSQTNQKTLYFNKFAIDNESYKDIETEATFLWENKNAIKLNINSTFLYFGIMDSKYGIYDDDGDEFDAYFVENLYTDEQAIIYLYHNLRFGMRISHEDGTMWNFHNSNYHLIENQTIKETLIQEEIKEDLEAERQSMGANSELFNQSVAVAVARQRPENRAWVGTTNATIGSDNDIKLEDLSKSWLGKQYDNLMESPIGLIIIVILFIFLLLGIRGLFK